MGQYKVFFSLLGSLQQNVRGATCALDEVYLLMTQAHTRTERILIVLLER